MESLLLNSFLGLEMFESQTFLNMIYRFAFNLVFTVIIVRFLYYPVAKRKDYLFTYIMISVVVFMLCYMLGEIKLRVGFALGLFAIFGIIRYRTTTVRIKEMTYLFIIIGMAVINSLTTKKVTFAELAFTNVIIVAITFGLEKIWLLKHEASRVVIFEKIELILPEKREELLADLKARTGLNIHRIQIGKIDFMRDTAQIKIFYYEEKDYSPDEDDYEYRRDESDR
jgi:hypothetical protein